jgi:hypothetical protein
VGKLLIDGREVKPGKKVKLHREIGPSRAKLVLEKPEELQRLKAELGRKPG